MSLYSSWRRKQAVSPGRSRGRSGGGGWKDEVMMSMSLPILQDAMSELQNQRSCFFPPTNSRWATPETSREASLLLRLPLKIGGSSSLCHGEGKAVRVFPQEGTRGGGAFLQRFPIHDKLFSVARWEEEFEVWRPDFRSCRAV